MSYDAQVNRGSLINSAQHGQPIPATATLTMTMAQVLDGIRACHAIADKLESQIFGPHPVGSGEKESEPTGVAEQALRSRTALMLLAERLDKLSNAI